MDNYSIEKLKHTFFKVEVTVPTKAVSKFVKLIQDNDGGRIRDFGTITVTTVTTYVKNYDGPDDEYNLEIGKTKKIEESKIEFVVSALNLEGCTSAIRDNHPRSMAQIKVIPLL